MQDFPGFRARMTSIYEWRPAEECGGEHVLTGHCGLANNSRMHVIKHPLQEMRRLEMVDVR